MMLLLMIQNVHSVLSLGCEEPCGGAHGDNDDEPDEDGVPEGVVEER